VDKSRVVLTGYKVIGANSADRIASTQLPGQFHRDLADQIIVATARVYDLKLLTVDNRIVTYDYVRTLDA
jgi:PIN domain nuclease of toxin-antitoxin system